MDELEEDYWDVGDWVGVYVWGVCSGWYVFLLGAHAIGDCAVVETKNEEKISLNKIPNKKTFIKYVKYR